MKRIASVPCGLMFSPPKRGVCTEDDPCDDCRALMAGGIGDRELRALMRSGPDADETNTKQSHP